MNEKPVIIYSDGDIAVAVKPRGVVSQASADSDGMVTMLKDALGGEIYPVHRLDRETCGVMVYARTETAARTLSDAFSKGSVDKRYLTVTLGTPEPVCGEYSDLLYHDARRNKSYVVTCARRGVREARLFYRVIETRGIESLVAVKLGTGRTHQIRVQFASRGTPVLGDRRYGGKPDENRWGAPTSDIRGIALSCVFLSFSHPVSGEIMRFGYKPEGAPWNVFDVDSALRSLSGTI